MASVLAQNHTLFGVTEVIGKVFERLEPAHLLRAIGVCRRFREVVEGTPSTQKILLLDRYEEADCDEFVQWNAATLTLERKRRSKLMDIISADEHYDHFINSGLLRKINPLVVTGLDGIEDSIDLRAAHGTVTLAMQAFPKAIDPEASCRKMFVTYPPVSVATLYNGNVLGSSMGLEIRNPEGVQFKDLIEMFDCLGGPGRGWAWEDMRVVLQFFYLTDVEHALLGEDTRIQYGKDAEDELKPLAEIQQQASLGIGGGEGGDRLSGIDQDHHTKGGSQGGKDEDSGEVDAVRKE